MARSATSARRVARLSRLEQGLPAIVTDPLTLDRLAALIDTDPTQQDARLPAQLPHQQGDGLATPA